MSDTALIHRTPTPFHATGLTPPVVLDSLMIGLKKIFIARDDLLPGGTKQRAALPYVIGLKHEGFRELIYASPFAGFAQVALAAACSIAGLRAKIFAQVDPATGKAHAFTELAASMGAKIILAEDLPEAEIRSLDCVRTPAQKKIPLGFDDPTFCFHLKHSLSIEWQHLCSEMPCPQQVWISLGSGTLTKTLRQVLPKSVRIRPIDVRVLPENDERLMLVRGLPNVEYGKTIESFNQPSFTRPPIPSNIHYDAKVWRHLEAEALEGDLWWNVAR